MKKVLIIIFVGIVLLVAFFTHEKKEAKILFVGDMMFDRYIRQVGYNKGEDFIFSCSGLREFLKDSDLVVGNLEGPITENVSRSLFTEPGGPGNYTFTFPTHTAKTLAKNNIKLVNLGNNHIGNFGEEGISSTKKYLTEAGVNYFFNNEIYRTKIGGQNVSFVSYNEFGLPAQAGGESAQKVAQKILEEKNDGQMVFVYAHWGDEYSDVSERVKNIAELFARSEADLIVGSHPHVILPHEKIDDTIIHYSLGNFIFDQYWNEQVSTGLVLEVNIKNKKINIIEHKVSLNRDGRTCLVN